MKIERQLTTPVLLTIFNRPDVTKRVFNEICKAKPIKLYVAADGPRDIEGDNEKCESARAIFEKVDWPCEVKFLFREKNLGCGLSVSTALDWFFENEPEGIILEDDCLPNESFFLFCRELLEKYRNDTRVMVIGGDNFQGGLTRGDGSYYFGKYPMLWGWAGWRRVWEFYDFKMAAFPKFKQENQIQNIFEDPAVQEFWTNVFELTYKGKIDTWDYQLQFAIWTQNGLCITPNVNLVSNIGCGQEDSTHTMDPNDPLANAETFPIDTITHPTFMMQDKAADEYDSASLLSTVQKQEEKQRKTVPEPIHISVVICTYNRAHLLEIALESLGTQTVDHGAFEIVVVNNNCTDATERVAREFMKRHANCRITYEDMQGLSHARNRGFKEARGKYVAYTDDDAKASPNWVEEMLAFIERNPDVEVFGGPYYEYSLQQLPEWLPSQIRSHTLGDIEHELNPDEWLHGCNMVFTKSILERYGGFKPAFGMNGKTIGYGEETELLLRIRKDTTNVFYVPTMYVEHLTDKKRLTLRWQLKSAYADGKYTALIFDNGAGFIKSMALIPKSILLIPFKFFSERNAPIKRRILNSLSDLFRNIGSFSGLVQKTRSAAK
jgi:glycosyltransferase involved in cell wall biosynthesis